MRNFKRATDKEKLQIESKKVNPQPVTSIPPKPRGQSPILLELDAKSIKLLAAVWTKDSVVNIHVVRATAKALINNNPSAELHLENFKMSHRWIQYFYRRMGFSCRTGTTTRPPVPKGLYDAYKKNKVQS